MKVNISFPFTFRRRRRRISPKFGTEKKIFFGERFSLERKKKRERGGFVKGARCLMLANVGARPRTSAHVCARGRSLANVWARRGGGSVGWGTLDHMNPSDESDATRMLKKPSKLPQDDFVGNAPPPSPKIYLNEPHHPKQRRRPPHTLQYSRSHPLIFLLRWLSLSPSRQSLP